MIHGQQNIKLLSFPKLKTHLKGHLFGTVENVQAALNNISSDERLHPLL
jgi:hypothetical protein